MGIEAANSPASGPALCVWTTIVRAVRARLRDESLERNTMGSYALSPCLSADRIAACFGCADETYIPGHPQA